MTTRLLPQTEWSKLDATYLAPIWRSLNPAFAAMLVCEDGDRIVGTWIFQLMAHVEGQWIHEDYRLEGSVMDAMSKGMAALLADYGFSGAFTEAGSPAIARYLKRRDAVETTHYLLSRITMSTRKAG